jgi:hypothetical protein
MSAARVPREFKIVRLYLNTGTSFSLILIVLNFLC